MNFKKYLLVLFFFCFSSLFSFSQMRPDIIWEKNDYEFEQLTSIWLYTLGVFGEDVHVWLEGRNKSDGIKRGNSYLKTNLKGELSYSVEKFRDDESDIFDSFFIQRTELSLIGMWKWPYEGFGTWSRQLHIYNFDENNEYNHEAPQKIDSLVYRSSAFPNLLYDSIYVCVDIPRFDETVFQYFYDQLIKVYDINGSFVRNLFLDTTGINSPLAMEIPPSFVFQSHDRTLMGSLYGPMEHGSDNDYIFVCKYDLSGKLIWNCKLEQESYDRMHLVKIFQLPDLNYFVQGRLSNYQNSKLIKSGFFFAKITANGEKLWYKEYEFEDGHKIFADMMPIQNSQYFALFGRAKVDGDASKLGFFLSFVDEDGKMYDEYIWHTETYDNNIKGLAELPSGNLLLLGRDGYDSIYLAEVSPLIVNTVNESTGVENGLSIFPNPASEYITIQTSEVLKTLQVMEIKIFNTLGECVMTDLTAHPSTGSGSGNLRIDVSHLPRGVYYVRIGNRTQMFVKV